MEELKLFLISVFSDASFQEGFRFFIYVFLFSEGFRVVFRGILYSVGIEEKKVKAISYRMGLLLNFPSGFFVAYYIRRESINETILIGTYYGTLTILLHWFIIKYLAPVFTKIDISFLLSNIIKTILKTFGIELKIKKK